MFIYARRKREKLVRRMRQFSSSHLLGGDSEVPKQSCKDSSTDSTDSGCSSNYRLVNMSLVYAVNVSFNFVIVLVPSL